MAVSNYAMNPAQHDVGAGGSDSSPNREIHARALEENCQPVAHPFKLRYAKHRSILAHANGVPHAQVWRMPRTESSPISTTRLETTL